MAAGSAQARACAARSAASRLEKGRAKEKPQARNWVSGACGFFQDYTARLQQHGETVIIYAIVGHKQGRG